MWQAGTSTLIGGIVLRLHEDFLKQEAISGLSQAKSLLEPPIEDRNLVQASDNVAFTDIKDSVRKTSEERGSFKTALPLSSLDSNTKGEASVSSSLPLKNTLEDDTPWLLSTRGAPKSSVSPFGLSRHQSSHIRREMKKPRIGHPSIDEGESQENSKDDEAEHHTFEGKKLFTFEKAEGMFGERKKEEKYVEVDGKKVKKEKHERSSEKGRKKEKLNEEKSGVDPDSEAKVCFAEEPSSNHLKFFEEDSGAGVEQVVGSKKKKHMFSVKLRKPPLSEDNSTQASTASSVSTVFSSISPLSRSLVSTSSSATSSCSSSTSSDSQNDSSNPQPLSQKSRLPQFKRAQTNLHLNSDATTTATSSSSSVFTPLRSHHRLSLFDKDKAIVSKSTDLENSSSHLDPSFAPSPVPAPSSSSCTLSSSPLQNTRPSLFFEKATNDAPHTEVGSSGCSWKFHVEPRHRVRPERTFLNRQVRLNPSVVIAQQPLQQAPTLPSPSTASTLSPSSILSSNSSPSSSLSPSSELASPNFPLSPPSESHSPFSTPLPSTSLPSTTQLSARTSFRSTSSSFPSLYSTSLQSPTISSDNLSTNCEERKDAWRLSVATPSDGDGDVMEQAVSAEYRFSDFESFSNTSSVTVHEAEALSLSCRQSDTDSSAKTQDATSKMNYVVPLDRKENQCQQEEWAKGEGEYIFVCVNVGDCKAYRFRQSDVRST